MNTATIVARATGLLMTLAASLNAQAITVLPTTGCSPNTPGHDVLFKKADVSEFGTLGHIDDAEFLLGLPDSDSRVEFSATDSPAVIDYVDADQAGSCPEFPVDNDIPSPPFSTDLNDESFALRATGYVQIPTAGTWTVRVRSDDGFRLRIGADRKLVSQFRANRGCADPSNPTDQQIVVPNAGLYFYELTAYERSVAFRVELSASGPGQPAFALIGDVAGTLGAFARCE